LRRLVLHLGSPAFAAAAYAARRGATPFHGLTPTATCCRRSAARWVARAFARGLSIANKCRPRPVVRIIREQNNRKSIVLSRPWHPVAVNLNALVALLGLSWITLFSFVSGERVSVASRFRPSAVAAYAARRGATPFQWPVPGIARPAPGSRPRLPAAAAPRLDGSPGRSPGDYQLLTSVAPSLSCGSYESETIRN